MRKYLDGLELRFVFGQCAVVIDARATPQGWRISHFSRIGSSYTGYFIPDSLAGPFATEPECITAMTEIVMTEMKRLGVIR